MSFIFTFSFLISFKGADAGEMQKNYITSSHINKPEALLQPDEHLALNKSPFCLTRLIELQVNHLFIFLQSSKHRASSPATTCYIQYSHTVTGSFYWFYSDLHYRKRQVFCSVSVG